MRDCTAAWLMRACAAAALIGVLAQAQACSQRSGGDDGDADVSDDAARPDDGEAGEENVVEDGENEGEAVDEPIDDAAGEEGIDAGQDLEGDAALDREEDPVEDATEEDLRQDGDAQDGEAAEDDGDGDAPPDAEEEAWCEPAPDFMLQDYNPDSATYLENRTLSETRGKVMVVSFWSYG